MPDVPVRDTIAARYPWAESLGLTQLISDLIDAEAGPAEIINAIRASDAYKQRFPGMVGPDGTRRFETEGTYLAQVESYRGVLRDYDALDPSRDNPMDYVAFFDAGIDPNELNDRFATYKALERGSTELLDAFYVYANMEVTVDDLFQAVVSPEFRQELSNEYDRGIAGGTLDYETFISRATERGLARVATLLGDLRDRGALSGTAMSQVLQVDPTFAREIMGALYIGSDPSGTGSFATETLSLDELSQSFSYALLASAATESGLEAPTRERLDEFRNLGIERAQLLRTYGQYNLTENAIEGMLQRGGFDDTDLTQSMFEEAALLGTSDVINRARGVESTLGRRGGGFQTAVEGTRFTQRGRGVQPGRVRPNPYR